MEEEQDMLSPDTQSFTAAAIKLYSEAKKTFPAKYPHEARFVCTDDWGAGGVSVYAKTAIRIVHTHAHTNARVDGRGADTQVGKRLLFTQPWQCP